MFNFGTGHTFYLKHRLLFIKVLVYIYLNFKQYFSWALCFYFSLKSSTVSYIHCTVYKVQYISYPSFLLQCSSSLSSPIICLPFCCVFLTFFAIFFLFFLMQNSSFLSNTLVFFLSFLLPYLLFFCSSIPFLCIIHLFYLLLYVFFWFVFVSPTVFHFSICCRIPYFFAAFYPCYLIAFFSSASILLLSFFLA